MITLRRYGQETPEGGIPTLWTPGLIISGLAIAAIVWMGIGNRRARRSSRAGRRRRR